MTDEQPPPIDKELVAEFVLKAHGDLAYVEQAVEREPAIVNAAWDWGGGDWETGLGAAAHVGRADIAEFLLERGARKDIFAAAMLGEVEVVRALLEAQPELRDARGPHGIPLRAHAEAGGERSREVLDLLHGAAATA
ncbi:MAG: ankyrin repeat domain-containing protein [Gaiellaceae bacterium]